MRVRASYFVERGDKVRGAHAHGFQIRNEKFREILHFGYGNRARIFYEHFMHVDENFNIVKQSFLNDIFSTYR